jgi:hypothetical protein
MPGTVIAVIVVHDVDEGDEHRVTVENSAAAPFVAVVANQQLVLKSMPGGARSSSVGVLFSHFI